MTKYVSVWMHWPPEFCDGDNVGIDRNATEMGPVRIAVCKKGCSTRVLRKPSQRFEWTNYN